MTPSLTAVSGAAGCTFTSWANGPNTTCSAPCGIGSQAQVRKFLGPLIPAAQTSCNTTSETARLVPCNMPACPEPTNASYPFVEFQTAMSVDAGAALTLPSVPSAATNASVYLPVLARRTALRNNISAAVQAGADQLIRIGTVPLSPLALAWLRNITPADVLLATPQIVVAASATPSPSAAASASGSSAGARMLLNGGPGGGASGGGNHSGAGSGNTTSNSTADDEDAEDTVYVSLPWRIALPLAGAQQGGTQVAPALRSLLATADGVGLAFEVARLVAAAVQDACTGASGGSFILAGCPANAQPRAVYDPKTQLAVAAPPQDTGGAAAAAGTLTGEESELQLPSTQCNHCWLRCPTSSSLCPALSPSVIPAGCPARR